MEAVRLWIAVFVTLTVMPFVGIWTARLAGRGWEWVTDHFEDEDD